MLDYNNIPEELRKLKQWVCSDINKIPRNPRTGTNAMANNPATWGTFEEALKGKEKYGFPHIGFEFKPPYFGVDLDKCIDDVDFVDEFVDTLGSYTEFSRSGNGIHIICKGKLPDGARRKDKVEMYDNARYFVMTGNIYREKMPIRECTETIKILHSKYLSKPVSSALPITYEKISLEDSELIDRARQSKNGGFFQLLYSGEWQGSYASQSDADLAFCNLLAFWTQKNPQQMDRIFRTSGLYRKKWDEKRGALLYSQMTIEKAIANCREVYDPKSKIENVVANAITKKDKTKYQEFDLTDTGNGQRFAYYYKNDIRYSKNRKKWFFWDGKVWREDTTNEIRRLADDCIEKMKKQAFSYDDEDKKEMLLKWAMKTASNKQKTNMIAETEHLREIAIDVDYFDIQPDLINVENGIINLRNGELISHSSEYRMSKIGFSEYKISNEIPQRWMQFLDEITDGDKDLQHYLQKAVGYSLTASTREQCLFICYGNGCNGKSTFMDVITTLMGTYALNMQSESIMVRKHTSAVNTDIARLNGSRFVTVAEPQEGMKLNESLVKQLTGGDKITARFLFGEEFEFKPQFKMWISTNHKPIISGTDNGIWRRIVLVPFTVKIPKEKIDRNLAYKLRKEMPLIMKWAVDGCIMWQKEGLEKPQCIQQASDEYREEMDVLSKFVADCVEEGTSQDRIKANELYEVYCNWANDNNEYCHTNTRFGKEFVLRFPEKEKMRDGIYYKNCKLNDFALENFKNAREPYKSTKRTNWWEKVED